MFTFLPSKKTLTPPLQKASMTADANDGAVWVKRSLVKMMKRIIFKVGNGKLPPLTYFELSPGGGDNSSSVVMPSS